MHRLCNTHKNDTDCIYKLYKNLELLFQYFIIK